MADSDGTTANSGSSSVPVQPIVQFSGWMWSKIGFEKLSLCLYHTTLLHDLGRLKSTEVLDRPAHAMTFELHGGCMAYEQLHTTAPTSMPSKVDPGSSWPGVGEGGKRRCAPVREVKEAALCACDADVVKVCVCVRGVRPSRPSGTFARQRRAAGKAGSEEDGARDGTEPVRKGGHGSRRTRPGATQA
ncbi:hypothetical protein B0H14DRAFT_3175654 [Mycena olivaceomarginata]|nr:hypothetical protein B0H14DRAFT_3175654 [Mycena olivaceomarginata]